MCQVNRRIIVGNIKTLAHGKNRLIILPGWMRRGKRGCHGWPETYSCREPKEVQREREGGEKRHWGWRWDAQSTFGHYFLEFSEKMLPKMWRKNWPDQGHTELVFCVCTNKFIDHRRHRKSQKRHVWVSNRVNTGISSVFNEGRHGHIAVLHQPLCLPKSKISCAMLSCTLTNLVITLAATVGTSLISCWTCQGGLIQERDE